MAESTTRTVLIPVDGSANSRRALTYLAKRARADKQLRICVLNVQLPLPPSLFVTRAMIAQHHDAISSKALKGVPAILSKRSLSAETLIRVGDPAQTIVQVAKRKHCVEIVMSTRGLGSLKGFILGSVTTKVIHLSRLPVTVVP